RRSGLRGGRRHGWRTEGRLRSRQRAREEGGVRRCAKRSDGAHEDGALHFCAVTTSLLSTVPVSPCTLAPSDSCQRPAMLKVALNLYVPGSVPGIGVTCVTISFMPSGVMS